MALRDTLLGIGFSADQTQEMLYEFGRSDDISRNLEIPDEAAGQEQVRILILALKVFGDQARAARWLCKKGITYGEKNPISLLETEEGRVRVQGALNQIDSGYFA